MKDPSTHYRKLENMMRAAPFVAFSEAQVIVGEASAEITLPVKEKLFHAAGAMHGALYFMALDNAAFFAVNSLVDDVFVLTTSFTIYLIAPVSEGIVTASGRVVNRTRSLFYAESMLHDPRGREIARGSGVFMRSKTPLAQVPGYR